MGAALVVAALMALSLPAASAQADDCPCIDSSSVLASMANCKVNDTDLGNTGVISGRVCYPISYGASTCAAFDRDLDPLCLFEDKNANPVPGYCEDQWCYVDFEKCKRSSQEMHLSYALPETGLYYSYATCGSSSNNYVGFLSTESIKGKALTVTMPAYWSPAHYKLTADGADMAGDAEYYDDSVPWQGWIIDYLNAIVGISNMGGLNFTYRSGGADVAATGSAWSAAVHDVHAGVSHLSGSSFWITSERLEKTAFTTPTSVDKIFLWVEQPTGPSVVDILWNSSNWNAGQSSVSHTCFCCFSTLHS